MFLIGKPKQFFGALKPMVRAAMSKKWALEQDAKLRSNEFAGDRDAAGLYLAPLDYSKSSVTDREEAFISSLVKHFPGMEASQRAYVSFLNTLRAEAFDAFWRKIPLEERATAFPGGKVGEAADEFGNYATRYASFVNAATGRGSVPDALNKYMPVATAALYSPRFLISRLQANGMGAKAIADVGRGVITRNSADIVSKEIAGDMLKFYSVGMSVLGLAYRSGASIEMNPASSDWGIIKIGDTRYDIWAGNQQLARNMYNMATGNKKTAGGEMKTEQRNASARRFVRGKLSPLAGLAVDVNTGRTMGYEPVESTPESARMLAFDKLTPLVIHDIADAFLDEEDRKPYNWSSWEDTFYEDEFGGVLRGAKALPAALGVGTRTYPERSVGSDTPPKWKSKYSK